jgi:hypothetical protein
MPVFVPVNKNIFELNGSVTFSAKAVNETRGVVNFVSGTDTSVFPDAEPTAAYIELLGDVNFFAPGVIDTFAYINFTTSGLHTYSVSAFVNFPYYYSLPASVSFSQEESYDTPASVKFFYVKDFPASVVFLTNGVFNLPANVFLGNLQKDTQASVSFTQFNQTDFNASIKIVQVVVQKTTGAYSSEFDTPATMQIIGVGNLTIPASVIFKVPPFDIDTPASVSFTQFSHNNYPATITIKNINLGGGCANITLQSSGSTTINAAPVPNPTPPPFSNQIVNVPSDATGFFQINNLTPGNYTVIPHYPGVTFTPASYEVTIVNSNVELSFTASGNVVTNMETCSVVPVITGDGCFIDQTQGQPGTYSIEGFIVIADNTLSNIFTVIIDPNIAQDFRGTLEL